MATDKVHRSPEALHALAKDIDETAGAGMQNLLRIHAHFENMPTEDTWNDREYVEYFEKYGVLRAQLDRVYNSMLILASDIHGTARRTEEAR